MSYKLNLFYLTFSQTYLIIFCVEVVHFGQFAFRSFTFIYMYGFFYGMILSSEFGSINC